MYADEIAQLRKYGLQTWAAFTVGHDGDTVDSIRATCDFAIRNKFTFAAFNILMPYPNTPLYEKLEREGRLLYDAAGAGREHLLVEFRLYQKLVLVLGVAQEYLTVLQLPTVGLLLVEVVGQQQVQLAYAQCESTAPGGLDDVVSVHFLLRLLFPAQSAVLFGVQR